MHPDAQQGIALIRRREFYQAHEYFETAWRETRDSSREFYRALLHLTGGFFRLTQERRTAARKFFTRSLYWLRAYPYPDFNLDTGRMESLLVNLIDAIDMNRPDPLEDFFPAIGNLLKEKLS